MTRTVSTTFGEALSPESVKLVNDVRNRIKQELNEKFNTDFNIYRFIMNAERIYKNRKDIVDSAAKAINLHLRTRISLKLDELEDIPFQKNPIFQNKFLPCGEILSVTDTSNRLLWYIEYATISIEGIAHGMKSSEAILFQFWQFEHMLRKVNAQEKKTGKLSSLRHIIDMTGYEINPFTMLFVSSGTLSYYSQLFHYDNYPELVNPIEMVNIAKWIHLPYKIIKTMMPAGFAERFRIHDGNFLPYLTEEIDIENIPTSLMGKNTEIKCYQAEKLPISKYWKPIDYTIINELETMHVNPRKYRFFRINVTKPKQKISWYFNTDGDVYFGVFFEHHSKAAEEKNKEIDLEILQLIYPWLKLSAKLHHEYDVVECVHPGIYYVVFCNRHSWLHRRTIDVLVQLSPSEEQELVEANKEKFKRCHIDGSQTELPQPLLGANLMSHQNSTQRTN